MKFLAIHKNEAH